MVAAGEIFGEQAIIGEGVFTASARVLESGVAYSIPSDVFQRICERRPDIWRLVVAHCLQRKEDMEQKDRTSLPQRRPRAAHLLSSGLAPTVAVSRLERQRDHISQNELASLVGATRETTSTTLNALARQGLIALGHRLVMIPSLEMLRERRDGPNKGTAAAISQDGIGGTASDRD